MRDLTGEWSGHYAYSVPAPGDPSATAVEIEDMGRRNPVAFVMSLREGFWSSVRGTIDDVGPGAVMGRAVLSGWRIGRKIRFTKTYPTRFKVMITNGTIAPGRPLDEVLTEIVGPEAFEKIVLPPHRIHYTGVIQPDGASIVGNWAIREAAVRIPGSLRYLRLKLTGLGTWSAARST